MLNLFQKPFEPETLDVWAKMSDDVAKVAVLAMPVLIYAKDNVWFKVLNVCLLAVAIYVFLLMGRLLRQLKVRQENKKEIIL